VATCLIAVAEATEMPPNLYTFMGRKFAHTDNPCKAKGFFKVKWRRSNIYQSP